MKDAHAHWKGDGSYEQDIESGSLRVPVKALNIIWGHDTRFWRFIELKDEESRLIRGFEEGALLVQVNWIEVTGRVPKQALMSMGGSERRYEIYYVVKFRVDAFGWHSAPLKFKVRVNKPTDDHHHHNYAEEESDEKIINLEPYREQQDVWHEIPGGQFSVSNSDGFVEFGMLEVDSAWWKGNMVLAGVKIKPIQNH